MQVWSNNRASPPAAALTVVCGDPLLMSGLQDCLTLATHKDDRLAQSAARLLCKHLPFFGTLSPGAFSHPYPSLLPKKAFAPPVQ